MARDRLARCLGHSSNLVGVEVAVGVEVEAGLWPQLDLHSKAPRLGIISLSVKRVQWATGLPSRAAVQVAGKSM